MKKFTLAVLTGFLFCSLTVFGQPNTANTRRPLGVTSQFINNTTKATVAATPPMGWNSWDNFGLDITEKEFKQEVDFVAANLKQYGYEYMVIDAGWYAPHLSAVGISPYFNGKLTKYQTNVDAYGRWIPAANKFPSAADGSFKSLADYVHSKGLKFGLHIQRGIPWTAIEKNLPIKGTKYHAKDIANPADACSWWDATLGVDMSNPGAQEYYNSCYQLWASWGIDFVKVDDISRPYHADEITAIRIAIEKTGRPIVLSLSPGTTPITARYHVQNNADMWRVSDDFWDSWPQLKAQFHLASQWMKYKKEGHWPDLDMLPIGVVATRCSYEGVGHQTNFNEDELETMMTLWCMFRSPLILGGDLLQLTPFEKDLVTNKTLLNIDQNGRNCREVFNKENTIIYFSEDSKTNKKYLSFFNLSDTAATIHYPWKDLGFDRQPIVKEVWSNESKDVDNEISGLVNPHGVLLFEIRN